MKWFLWHGNVVRALHTVHDLTTDLGTSRMSSPPSVRKLTC